MKAAKYLSKNKLDILETEVPKPQIGEALIKVEYSSLCGSDLHIYKGNHPTAKFPVTPGHEFVGELVQLGEKTESDIKLGTKVVAQPYTSCNTCEACITGNDNVCTDLKLLGAHRDGCFAEYVVVDVKKIYALSDDIDLRLAALTEPLAVGIHDINRSNLKIGDKILIIGGGPIGIIIALVAELAGAEIYISEIDEYRIKFINELGFKTLNPLDKDYAEQICSITNGENFDIVFEVSGSKSGIQSATSFASAQGTVMIVGMAAEPYPVNTTEIFLKQLTLKGVRIHSQSSFKRAAELINIGTINEKLGKLISKEYDLNDIVDAYEYVINNNDYFKIIFKV